MPPFFHSTGRQDNTERRSSTEIDFTAMQFNFVVKSNAVAVKLWQDIGFEIIGEIPDAMYHAKNGLTNAYIMYRKL